jgi:hypothetical protein
LLASADGGALSALDGTWQLDLAKSDDPTSVLEKLDVGWLIKKAAPTTRPTHVIVTAQNQATIEIQSPLSTRKSTLIFDGKSVATDDFFGSAIEYTANREGDTIVTHGVMKHSKLGKVAFDTRRLVQDDGTMLYAISLTVPGEAPRVLKRVFRKK